MEGQVCSRCVTAAQGHRHIMTFIQQRIPLYQKPPLSSERARLSPTFIDGCKRSTGLPRLPGVYMASSRSSNPFQHPSYDPAYQYSHANYPVNTVNSAPVCSLCVSLQLCNPTANFRLSHWTLEHTPMTRSYRMRFLAVPTPLHRSTPRIFPLPFPLTMGRLSRVADMILPFPQTHRSTCINLPSINKECRSRTRTYPSLRILWLQPPLRHHRLIHTCTPVSGGWGVAPGWHPVRTGIWESTFGSFTASPETRRTSSAAIGDIATSNCNG